MPGAVIVRRRYLATLPLLGAVVSALLPASVHAAKPWGCYDPRPGHPTAAEKAAYVAEISRLAVDAERSHGVPAPAIAAMAIEESGYGFTRTALEANNLFGYKWTSRNAAGGRDNYVLACQPEWDVNNKYIRFASRADAMDFVAHRLATSSFYRNDTSSFQAAIATGQERDRAIREWVAGIAEPYNFDPARYTRKIERLMNDPLNPADHSNPADSLYLLVP